MVRRKLARLKRHASRLTKRQLIAVAVVTAFVVVGIGLLAASRAATYAVAVEAETGTITGGGKASTQSGSSAGSAVTFGTGGTGGTGGGNSTCAKNGSCTAAEVATHTSQSDCWVIYSNKVYDVTNWVPIHNGGTAVFNSTTCGHDVTSFLAGQASSAGRTHKHSQNAYDTLNTYYFAGLK